MVVILKIGSDTAQRPHTYYENIVFFQTIAGFIVLLYQHTIYVFSITFKGNQHRFSHQPVARFVRINYINRKSFV